MLAFMCILLTLIVELDLDASQFVNMDETGIFYATIIARVFAKSSAEAKVASNSDECKRLTKVSCQRGDGTILPTLLITKGAPKTREFVQYMHDNDLNPYLFDVEYELEQVKKPNPNHSGDSPSRKRKADEDKTTHVKRDRKGTSTTPAGKLSAPDNTPSKTKNRKAPKQVEDETDDIDGDMDETAAATNVEDGVYFGISPDERRLHDLTVTKGVVSLEKSFSETVFASGVTYTIELINAHAKAAGVNSDKRSPTKTKDRSIPTVALDDKNMPFFVQGFRRAAIDSGNEDEQDKVDQLESMLYKKCPQSIDFKSYFAFQVRKLAKFLPTKVTDILSTLITYDHVKDYISQYIDHPRVVAAFSHTPVEEQVKLTSFYHYKQDNAWATEPSVKFAVENCIAKEMKSTKKPWILMMDNFSAHRKASVTKVVRENGGIVLFFPAYCTSLLQPLDLLTNALLKKYLGRINLTRYNQYKTNKSMPVYLRNHDRQMMNVMYAWSRISTRVVTGGFKLMYKNMKKTFDELSTKSETELSK